MKKQRTPQKPKTRMFGPKSEAPERELRDRKPYRKVKYKNFTKSVDTD